MFRPNSATPAADALPISADERAALFSSLQIYPSLLAAVSGGRDSMALLALLDDWRKDKNIQLFAASVDHGLRAEAASECAFVAAFCNARNIPHVVLRWSNVKPLTGIQEAAREARYSLLAQAAKNFGCSAVATAHTLDDQAETLLMRLARGSGLAGLQGMPQNSEKHGIALLRPLLDVPRARLAATLFERNIDWCEDPSNTDASYLRPRLRSLLPRLAEEGLDALRFALFAKKMRRANTALDRIAETVFVQIRDATMERSLYREQPDEIRLRVLQKMISSLNPQDYPAGDAQLESLDAELAGAHDVRQTLGGVVFSAGSRFLRFSRESDPRQKS